MVRCFGTILMILVVTGCRDPIPPPRVVHFVNFSAEQTRAADSLSRVLTTRFVAVPDSFVQNGQDLRVTFLHAPFASWQEPGCRGTYTSAEFAKPVAQVVWDALGKSSGVKRITIVGPPLGRQEYGSWWRWVACESGRAQFHFHPRDFALAEPKR